MLRTKPSITPAHRKNPDGTIRENWLVYCGTGLGGTPVKYYRNSERKAKELAKQNAEMVKRVGQAAEALTAAQMYDAAEAFQTLQDAQAGISLSECARQWLERNGDALECKTARICECVDEYMTRFDRSKDHYHTVKNALAKFVTPFGDQRRMSELDRATVESFLALYDNPKSFNLNRGYVLAFLNWARKNGRFTQSQYNACLCIDVKKVPYKRPRFMHAEDVEKIMRWCEKQPDVALIATKFALGFFAGIRSSEIDKMVWEKIHFDTKEMTVERPKGDEETLPRTVTMSDNLEAWLSKYAQKSGRICYRESTMTDRKKVLAEETGINLTSKQNRNISRHTFCTMHFALHRNYAITQAELGHNKDSGTFVNNYNNSTSKTDATAFWNIMPKTQTNKEVEKV